MRGLLLLLLAVVLVPIVAAQLITYYSWYSVRSAAELDQNLEVARGLAVTFRSYVHDLARTELALGWAIVQQQGSPNAEYGVWGPRPFSTDQARELLRKTAAEYPAIFVWHWIRPDGVVLASTLDAYMGRDVTDRPYWPAVRSSPGWIVTDLYPSSIDGRQLFAVARPIRDKDNQLLGIVSAATDPAKMDSLHVRGRGADMSLFDRTGRLVYVQPKLALKEPHPLIAGKEPLLDEVRRGGHEEAGRYTSAVDGLWRLGACVPIEGTGAPGWIAGASTPVDLAMGPVREMIVLAGLALLLVLVLSLVLGYFIRSRIHQEVSLLSRHAQRIGQGELDHRMPDLKIRDLDVLKHAFDDMAKNLAESRQQTELKTQELKRSNQDLEQFAYIASHDLQEPLRMVTGYLELLQRRYQGKLDKQADEFIHFAVDGARRMQALIVDLLEYSRIGTRAKAPENCDMQEALEMALANLKAAIQETSAQITHDKLPQVRADCSQMAQLLQNLLANAIKFRSNQPPQIHVGASENDRECVFRVRDNGIGIEPQHLQRTFQIFQRLHPRDKYPGTGIGLAICKRIVERHGGRIWAESQPGSGSTFFFCIPR
jgi:signal transduction histidine kinase